MSQKSALIVDDSRTAREVLRRMLADHDLRVETAESAEAALEFLGAHRPDVIFMDHMMPGMDGFQAVKAIKENPATATIPVLMYTTASCPYCIQAERLLARKGVTNLEKVRVDLDSARRVEMMEKTGQRTVPQIYIGERHVGGFDELAALERAGQLDALLAGQLAAQ